MKTNYVSPLPTGLPRQTYINGVPRDAEVGEPANDINDIVNRLSEVSQNLPNTPQDINAAPTDSPAFTGIASSVTPSQGTATTQIATTEFVVKALQNALALIGTNTTAPQAPTLNPVNVSTAGRAVLSWITPTYNGGAPITGYSIYIDGAVLAGVSGSTLTYNTSLPAGSHTAFVTAINAIGEGTPSPTVSFNVAVLVTVPNPPTSVNAVGGTQSATISFVAPTVTGNSAITGYIVTAHGAVTQTFSGTTSPIVVTGLTAGNYTFTVQSVNSSGLSAPSASTGNVVVSSSIVSLPPSPTNVTATGGPTQAVVYFTPPANSGSAAITRYVVTATGPQVISATGTTSPITITGLTPGTYTFTVASVNSAGQGPTSTVSAPVNVVVSSTVPGAPTLQTPVSAGSSSETFTWNAPTNNGGSAITGYNIYLDGVLVAGSITIPDAPTVGIPNTSTPNQVVVSWTPPANNGGSTITGYNVYVDGVIVAPNGPTVPSAPTVGTPIVSTPNQATFNWTNPVSNGGSPVIGFNVYVDGIIVGSTRPTVPSAPILATPVVSGPNQATFSWTSPTNNGGSIITAYNVYVDGVLVSNAVMTAPGAPTVGVPNVSIPGQVQVSWSAPNNNGGSPVTGYNVRVDGILE